MHRDVSTLQGLSSTQTYICRLQEPVLQLNVSNPQGPELHLPPNRRIAPVLWWAKDQSNLRRCRAILPAALDWCKDEWCHVPKTFNPKAQNDKGVCTYSDLSEGTVTKEDNILEAKEAPDLPEGTVAKKGLPEGTLAKKQPEHVLRETMFLR